MLIKILGSLALYAPGKLTVEEGEKEPDPDTLICAQDW